MSSMLSAVFTRRCCVQAYACLFVLLLLSVPCKSIFKEAEDRQNPAESSGSPPDEQPMQPNAKRDWLCGQHDVHLFLPFFLPVHSAGPKLTVRRAWMSKSQGQTRELYSVLMRIRLDVPTESGWVGCSDRVWMGWMFRPSLDVPIKSRRTMLFDLCVRCAVANVGRRLEE